VDRPPSLYIGYIVMPTVHTPKVTRSFPPNKSIRQDNRGYFSIDILHTMTRTTQGHLNASGQTNDSDGAGSTSAMPIAVIGMGCRLAGTATSPQKLWQMLTRGQSGWSRGDNARFKMDSFYHPSKEMKGAVCWIDDGGPVGCIQADLNTVQYKRPISSKTRRVPFRSSILPCQPA